MRDIDVPASWGGILVLLEGVVSIGDEALAAAQAIGFATDSDDGIRIAAGSRGARIALVCGEQLKQPVFAYGPLMMASPVSLDEARQRAASLSVPA